MTERAKRLREGIARRIYQREREEGHAVVPWDDMPKEHRAMYGEEAALVLRAVVEELGIVQGVVETARVHAKLTEAQPGSPNDVMHTALATLLEASGAER